LVIFGIMWWTQVHEDPYNVYWGMLDNTLKTSAVTKHITETANGAKLDQYISLNFGTDNAAYARTTLTNANGVVKTESIGTLQNDYVRYTSIQSSSRKSKPDTSKVLGKWAKAGASNTSDNNSAVPFFIQVMLGFEGGNLVPIANLPAADRASLLHRLHTDVIFQPSFNEVQRQNINGRPIYAYPVEIEPVAYVAYQKAFAAALGIKTLDQVDPNSYQNQSTIKVKLLVDARSYQLVGIQYPSSNHTESYVSYGIATKITMPHATISDQKLQSLLSAIK
jgi:hypothetical protein